MIILKSFSKVFSTIGEILAFLTIILIGLLYLNDVVPVKFLPEDTYNTLNNIKNYAVIITITVCGFAFASRRSIIIFIPFCILAVCALACYSIIVFG